MLDIDVSCKFAIVTNRGVWLAFCCNIQQYINIYSTNQIYIQQKIILFNKVNIIKYIRPTKQIYVQQNNLCVTITNKLYSTNK